MRVKINGGDKGAKRIKVRRKARISKVVGISAVIGLICTAELHDLSFAWFPALCLSAILAIMAWNGYLKPEGRAE